MRAFAHFSDEADAADIEHACFCASRGAVATYRHRAMRALHGLEHGRLQQHVRGVGAVQALRLPTEDVYGRDPHRERMHKEDRREAEAVAFLQDLASSDLVEVPDAGIRCRRCSSNNVAFEFLQTRSADEGTTTYCTCANCKMRWKM